MEGIHGWYNEDGFICCNYKQIFEQYGMKFTSLQVAIRFSQEVMLPEGRWENLLFFRVKGQAKIPISDFLSVHIKVKQKFYNIAHLVKNSIQ